MPEIKEIYTATIYYKGNQGDNKIRPVLILNKLSDEIFTIAEITSVPPKDPPSYYDQFKHPIDKWQECGLKELSYVKCKNVHNVSNVRFNKFLGIVDDSDFLKIVNKISDCI